MAATAPIRAPIDTVFVQRPVSNGQVNYICLHCFLTVEKNEYLTVAESLDAHQITCEGPPHPYPRVPLFR